MAKNRSIKVVSQSGYNYKATSGSGYGHYLP